jgi:hypothetical protein
MRQIFALIFVTGLIILAGCNVSTLIHSPMGVLCVPLSLGFAMLFIIWVLERKSNSYLYDDYYYSNVGSLLTDRMYEKNTIGDALVSRAGATIGTGLFFLIVHATLNITSTPTDTAISSYVVQTSSISNFLIDAGIVTLILLFTTSLKYIKNNIPYQKNT